MRLLKKIHFYFQRDRKFRGQGMVEFALVIPIFMLLTIGVFEFGRLFTALITVNTASREAARYGSAVGISGAGVPFYQDCAGIQNASSTFNLFANVTSVDIRYDAGPDDPRDWDDLPACGTVSTINLADRVVVQIRGEYSPIILFSGLVVPIKSTTHRTVITKLDIRSTQYAVDMPTVEPSETPEGVNYCDNISVNNITGSGSDYSFEITNLNESYHAVFDEIWFYLSGTSTNKYFDQIVLVDTGESPEVEMVSMGFDVNADPSRFIFLPRTLGAGGTELTYDGSPVGVLPEGTTRVDFSFTNPSVVTSSIKIKFFGTACEKITTP